MKFLFSSISFQKTRSLIGFREQLEEEEDDYDVLNLSGLSPSGHVQSAIGETTDAVDTALLRETGGRTLNKTHHHSPSTIRGLFTMPKSALNLFGHVTGSRLNRAGRTGLRSKINELETVTTDPEIGAEGFYLTICWNGKT